jgi:transposase
VWDRLHRLVLDELSENQLIDWSRGCIDSVSVRGKGGELTGPNPTDRGKPGTKYQLLVDATYHLLVDATGLILHTLLSPANTHDSMLFEPLLETNAPASARIATGPDGPVGGRRSCTPTRATTARAAAVPAPPGDQGPYRPPRHRVRQPSRRVRWGVERSISLVLRFKRLGLRYDRTKRTTRPLLTLACVLINLRRLVRKILATRS